MWAIIIGNQTTKVNQLRYWTEMALKMHGIRKRYETELFRQAKYRIEVENELG